MTSLPSHLRYNLILNTAYDSTDPNVTLRATRSNPVLPANSDQYEAIIERFSVPLANVPMFICPTVIGQTDPTLTPFQVTLQSGGLIQITANSNDGFVLQLQDWQGNPANDAQFCFQIPAGLYSPQRLCDFVNASLQSTPNTSFIYPVTALTFQNGRFAFTMQTRDSTLVFSIGFNSRGAVTIANPSTIGAAAQTSGGTLWQTLGFSSVGISNGTGGNIAPWTAQSAPTLTPTITSSRNVVWQPQTLGQPIPAPPTTTQDATSMYYYAWSYQWMMDRINETLEGCLADLVSQGTTGLTESPYFEYDPSTTQFLLYGLSSLYDDQGGYVRLYLNEALMTLLPNFHCRRQTDTVMTWQYIFVPNMTGSNIIDNRIVMSQEFPSLGAWSPLDAVVLTSQNIPVIPEGYAPVSVTGVSNRGNQQSSTNAQLSIISDMMVSSSVGFEWKQGVLEYLPSSEYRVCALSSKERFNDLDVSFLWRDRFGVLRPLTMPQGSCASLKLLFRLKGYDPARGSCARGK